jgi:hypothetical protein
LLFETAIVDVLHARGCKVKTGSPLSIRIALFSITRQVRAGGRTGVRVSRQCVCLTPLRRGLQLREGPRTPDSSDCTSLDELASFIRCISTYVSEHAPHLVEECNGVVSLVAAQVRAALSLCL